MRVAIEASGPLISSTPSAEEVLKVLGVGGTLGAIFYAFTQVDLDLPILSTPITDIPPNHTSFPIQVQGPSDYILNSDANAEPEHLTAEDRQLEKGRQVIEGLIEGQLVPTEEKLKQTNEEIQELLQRTLSDAEEKRLQFLQAEREELLKQHQSIDDLIHHSGRVYEMHPIEVYDLIHESSGKIYKK